MNPKVTPLSDIWPTLYPHTKTPKIEKLLYDIFDKTFTVPEKEDPKRPDDWKLFYRYDRKSLDVILKSKKPWLEYSWIQMSQTEDPELYSPTGEHSKLCKSHYGELKRDREDQIKLVEKAKTPEDIEWWCYVHNCGYWNGIFLMTLLAEAFPKKKFKVVETTVHVWVCDEEGRNYDLIWPLLDITSYQEALDKGKVFIHDKPLEFEV